MDWTKAKNILIVALVVTNLIILTSYLIQSNRLSDDEKEMQDVTVKLLEEKNIFVDTEIPDERPRMPKLTVQYDKADEDVIREQMEAQAALPPGQRSDENLVAMTTEFMQACGLMTGNVVFDQIRRTGEGIEIAYKNDINGIAIEDSHMIFTVKNGKITGFDRYWLQPVELNEMERQVVPARAALIKFMSEKTGEEKVSIEKISLVYWLDPSGLDTESPVTDTAFPAWKITYNEGQIRHIMAWDQ